MFISSTFSLRFFCYCKCPNKFKSDLQSLYACGGKGWVYKVVLNIVIWKYLRVLDGSYCNVSVRRNRTWICSFTGWSIKIKAWTTLHICSYVCGHDSYKPATVIQGRGAIYGKHGCEAQMPLSEVGKVFYASQWNKMWNKIIKSLKILLYCMKRKEVNAEPRTNELFPQGRHGNKSPGLFLMSSFSNSCSFSWTGKLLRVQHPTS